MKRHKDLIQAVLEFVESGDNRSRGLSPPQGYTSAQVAYHQRLCRQAGFVDEDGLLTWDGHEKLCQLRKNISCTSRTVWI